MHQTSKRFYFVDESGQQTLGLSFTVAIAVVGDNKDELEQICLAYETQSKKGTRKWQKSSHNHRMEFARLVLNDKRFVEVLCFNTHVNFDNKSFDANTLKTIARTIKIKVGDERSSSEIYVDGLSQKKQEEYSTKLRREEGIRGAQFHRANDNFTFIRLADTLAGLIQSVIKGNEEAKRLIAKAIANKVIVEV